jgi:ubiquinone/menaquinone biosynthesis C-methylase UbiE
MAVDVGCGTGQSTFNLAPYFKRVLGIDYSDSQIKQAIKAAKESSVAGHVQFMQVEWLQGSFNSCW